MAETFAEFIARLRIEDNRTVLQTLKQTETAIVATATRSQAALDRLGTSSVRSIAGLTRATDDLRASSGRVVSGITAFASAASLLTGRSEIFIGLGLANEARAIARAFGAATASVAAAAASLFILNEGFERLAGFGDERTSVRMMSALANRLEGVADAQALVAGQQEKLRQQEAKQAAERKAHAEAERKRIDDERKARLKAHEDVLTAEAILARRRELDAEEDSRRQLEAKQLAERMLEIDRESEPFRQLSDLRERRSEFGTSALLSIGALRASELEPDPGIRRALELQEQLEEARSGGGRGQIGFGSASSIRFAKTTTGEFVEGNQSVDTMADSIKKIEDELIPVLRALRAGMTRNPFGGGMAP